MNEINANSLILIDRTGNRANQTPAASSVQPTPASRLPVASKGARSNKQTDSAPSQGIRPSSDALAARIQEINQQLRSGGTQLKFSLAADSNRTIIQVIDKQTSEVIRQIPPEEVVSLAEHLAQFNRLESLGLQEQT